MRSNAKNLLTLALTLGLTLMPTTGLAQSKPDILVLGDSQISFGAGKKYLNFFQNLQERCGVDGGKDKLLKKLGKSRTAAIGVRSTSLGTWTARGNAAKASICEVDKRFGVNAGAYGIAGNPERRFIQIGKGRDYQFCKANTSPFEALLTKGYYDPKLIVLAFLGNSAGRWAGSAEAAAQDLARTLEQIPKDTPCIFLTTAPVFSKRTNDLRQKAQVNMKAAFAKTNGHCQFVEGFTKQTRSAIEGNSRYFAKRKNGSVKDPLHPSGAAIDIFLNITTPRLCTAVFAALK
jgi:hypothetical protein